MAKKENQRITLTRRLLQEGLLTLLEEKPLEKITVTELCQVSGINRSTFYHHYDAPQEVLADMEEQITRELEAYISDPGAPDDTLDNLEKMCVYFRENAKLITVLIECDADKDLAAAFSQLYARYRSMRPRLSENLSEERLHLTATFLYSGCYHMVREWLTKDLPMTPREVAELALTIINREYW